jgi:leucyl-tRNA synthetase
LNEIKGLKEWPEKVSKMQQEWIKKSKGVTIEFKLKESEMKLNIFTTRPETIFGVTFLTISKEHKKLKEIQKNPIAIHPITQEEIPILISDYVISEYGEGKIKKKLILIRMCDGSTWT